MAVQVACDNCGTRLTLKDDSRLGQKMKCPKCQNMFVAEEAEEATPKKKAAESKSKSAKGKKGASKGKSKKGKSQEGFPVVPVVLGGTVLLLLVGVGIWFAFSGSGDAPPPASSLADSTSSDTSAAMDESTPPSGAPSTPAEPEAVVVNPGILNTEWLPQESLLVMSFKLSSIMKSPMVKPTIDSPLIKLMLSGYEQQYGLKLESVESVTIGVGMDPASLTMAAPPAPGTPPPPPSAPPVVTVMRMSVDFTDAGAQKLAQAISAASQQAAMAASQRSGMAVPNSSDMAYDTTMTTGDSGTSAIGDARARMNPGAAAAYQSSAPAGVVPSSDGTATTEMDYDGAMSPGGSTGTPAPNVYALSMAPANPNAPPASPMGLSLVNPRTMVLAPLDQLKQMVAAKPSNPQAPFAFVKQDGDIVIAGQFDFLAKIKPLLEAAPPGMSMGFAPLLQMYDEGARGGSLSLSLANQIDIKLSISGKDPESARSLAGKLQDQMKAGAASNDDDDSALPESVQETLQSWLKELKTEETENVTTLSFSLSPSQLADLQKDALASTASLLSAQPGMLGGFGGGALEQAFPGLSAPKIPRMPLAGPLQQPVSTEGLPEKTKLALVTHWSDVEVPGVAPRSKIDKSAATGTRGQRQPQGQSRPPQSGTRPGGRPDATPMTLPDGEASMNLPPGSTGQVAAGPPEPPPAGVHETVLELALVVTGRKAEEIVQYQEPRIDSAIDSNGQPLKRRNGVMIPLSTPQTWVEAPGVVLDARNQEATLLPIRFDSLAGGVAGVSEITGKVNVRISQEIEDILLDPRNPQALPIARLQAAGVRVVVGAAPQGRTIYLLPDSERTVLVGLHPASQGTVAPPAMAGAGSYPGGSYPGMINDNPEAAMTANTFAGGTPGGSEEEMRRQMEANANSSGIPNGPGGASNPLASASVAPAPDRIGHVSAWNPQGFQIPATQMTPLILRVARDPEERTISFSFKNVSVPTRPSADEPAYGDWVAVSGSGPLSDGITTAYVRTGWAEAPSDERRSRLNVWIDLVGPDAAKVFSAGSYTLGAAVANDNKTLTLDDKHPDAIERPRGFDPIDARFSGVQTPPEACRLNFPLMVLSPAFDSLTNFEGNLRIKMSDGIESVTIDKLGDQVGKRITNTLLNGERALPTLEYADGLATLVFPSSAREKVLSIELVDAQGRYEPSYPLLVSRQEKEDRYSFRVDDKTLKKLGVKVVLHKGIKNGNINFKFENVPVPPLPVQATEE